MDACDVDSKWVYNALLDWALQEDMEREMWTTVKIMEGDWRDASAPD